MGTRFSNQLSYTKNYGLIENKTIEYACKSIENKNEPVEINFILF